MRILKRVLIGILVAVLSLVLIGVVLAYKEKSEMDKLHQQNEEAFKAQTGMSYAEHDKVIEEQTKTNEALAKDLEESNKYQLIEHKAITENGIGYISGKIKNNTDEQLSYLEVDINLYDKDGVQVGDTMDIVQNLGARGTWEFKAPVLEGNVAKYEIVSIQ